MRKTITILFLAGVFSSMIPAFANSPSHEQWFQKIVQEANQITRGSTRASVLKLFSVEKIQQGKEKTDVYVFKSCKAIRTNFIFIKPGPSLPGVPHGNNKGPLVFSTSRLILDYPTDKSTLTENEKWLIPMIDDYHAIKPGMPLSKLLEKFEQDNGLNTIPATRFIHKNCSLVKMDANFEPKTKNNTDPIIHSVSLLYADPPVVD